MPRDVVRTKTKNEAHHSHTPAGRRIDESVRARVASGLLFDDFVAPRVITLATLLRRTSALRFQRMFGLALVEWLLLIRIGARGPLSSNELAAHVGIGKSQTSRAITGLVARELVRRQRNPSKSREVELTLTLRGRRIYKGIIKAGVIRNDELTHGIAAREVEIAKGVLEALTARARELLLQEQETSTDRTPPSDTDLNL